MVPFVNLAYQHKQIEKHYIDVLKQLFERNSYILGCELESFEKEFADYLGCNFAIGVNSGSDALFLAVKVLGIGPRDEVITVANTFISTVDAIVRNGAAPVFVDIDPVTYCMAPTQIETKITSRTRAILPVHLYGHPAEMNQINEIAKRHNLYIIEDSCQAHGAEYNGKKTGTWGDIACFSFYPVKNLGAYGDGGMIVTNNKLYAERLRLLRNYGQTEKYIYDYAGINSRLDEMQAALLRIKLPHLDKWNEQRRRLAQLYNMLLKSNDLIILPAEQKYCLHVYHLYVIQVPDRDSLIKNLKNKGVGTQIHYPIPVHKQKQYINKFSNIQLPFTEAACSRIVSLPIYPGLKDSDVEYIADKVHACLK